MSEVNPHNERRFYWRCDPEFKCWLMAAAAKTRRSAASYLEYALEQQALRDGLPTPPLRVAKVIACPASE
jgi:hypothetical protein